MKDFVIKMLKGRLPPNYSYHNCQHTLYVTEKAMEIARAEGCTEAEIRLIQAAALWHDTGFIYQYPNHEEKSCQLVRQRLPDYGFSAEEIRTICGMIMATKTPQCPRNKLEEVIADADLEYLGTENAEKMAGELFKELRSINPLLDINDWRLTEISFLRNHHYFTRYCRAEKESGKQAYLERLEKKKIIPDQLGSGTDPE